MAAVNPPLTLLTIPLEIRVLIYGILFSPSEHIAVTAAPQYEDEEARFRLTNSTTWSTESGSWAMTPRPLSSQLLRVSQQLYAEALPFLYSRRIFDLTARDTLKILLHNIGPRSFASIKRIVIEWDELEQFAWDLKKPEYIEALSGLSCIQIATWRHRHMYGTSTQWRSVKGRERTLLQAALEVTDKHARLKILAEEPFRRKSSSVMKQPEAVIHHRVKWRFVTDEKDLSPGEIIVNVKKDLESLKATQQEADDVGFSLTMNDLI